MRREQDLRDSQLAAIDWIFNKKRCGLFLGMGVGKTGLVLTALQDLAQDLLAVRPLIIGTKLIAEKTWPDEVASWEHTKGFHLEVIKGTPKQRLKRMHTPADAHVISVDNLVWLIDQWGKDWPYDAVIVDESSMFKDPTSNRFKKLKRVASKSDYFVLLTGTPNPMGYLNLWSQMYLLDGGQRLGKYYADWTDRQKRRHYGFREKYFDSDWGGFNWTLKEGALEEIDRLVGELCISIEVDLNLPPMTMKYHKFNLTPKRRADYAELEKELLLAFDDATVEAVNPGVLSNKLRQFAAGALYLDEESTEWEDLHHSRTEYMRRLRAKYPDESLLVAYHYKFEWQRIKEAFPEAISIKDKGAINRWNAGTEPLIMGLHPKSGGHGLNLQFGGRRGLWYTMDYSREEYDQLNKRLHRPGQTREVFIHHFICRDTLDDLVILPRLKHRGAQQEAFLAAVRLELRKKYE